MSTRLTQNKRDVTRRVYWTRQMELAYDFMNKMRDYPVVECRENLVSLQKVVKKKGLTVQFSDSKISGKYDRIFYLREGLIKNFISLSREINNRGWVLKVEDGFRSREMQKYVGLQEFVFDVILQRVIWENNGKIPSPELMLRRFTAFIAISPKLATHMSGSALDISVYHADKLCELDRGGPYLEMSELTFMDSPFISKQADKNRIEINTILRKQGFVAYPFEFWHFSQGDAYDAYLRGSDKPARYGAVDFDLSSEIITPVAEPKKSLHSPDIIKNYIDAALKRFKYAKSKVI